MVSIGDLTWGKYVDISTCLSHDKMNQIVRGLLRYELPGKQGSYATVETHKMFCHLSARGFCHDFTFALSIIWVTAVAQWLRRCATNRMVAGSIPDGVTGIFH